MRRATLLFNPVSGRPARRAAAVERIADALRAHGIHVTITPTLGPDTAGAQAAAADTDILFACGGDGTIHDVLQGLALHPSAAALGVIPFGTANALARHLRLSLNPVKAALQQIHHTPRMIPLGRVTCHTAEGPRSRFFIVMAGAGPDGALVYRMLATGKHRLGRSIYYLRAARLFLSARFPAFSVQAHTASAPPQQITAVSAIAVRVADLGGLFSPLTRPASPADNDLQLTLTEPPHHLALPAWFATSWTRTHSWNPYTQHLRVTSFECDAGPERVHVQADGEFLGYTPMHVELVPDALRLLMPPASPPTSPPAR